MLSFIKKNYKLLILALLCCSCSQESNAPLVEAEYYDGKKMHLTDFKQEYLLLNFFSKSCSYCSKILPEINRVANKYGSKMHVVFISLDPVFDLKSIPEYTAIANSTVVKDKMSISKYRYNVSGTPSFFLVQDNKIISSQTGYSSSLDELLKKIK